MIEPLIVLLLVLLIQIGCNIIGYSKGFRYYRWGVTVFLLISCIAVFPYYFSHRRAFETVADEVAYKCGNEYLGIYIAFYIFGVGGILVINLLFSLWKWGCSWKNNNKIKSL
ncbi:MAG: hypothetical protein LBI72_09125 [Flavobacteriaceae bacterium]|jgi:phosphoglycerol transferase MdoB-like AlkP superfamily enzyme|nr:hypothetical protein [Flavobacteriaceae bacterium]